MSGICAVGSKDDRRQSSELLARMLTGVTLDMPERQESRAVEGAAIGVSAQFATQQFYENDRLVLACDADLYNLDALAGLVAGSRKGPGDAGTAALLAALYERFGTDFVAKLEGGFSVVLWDIRERRLVAAIDGFGIKRLVYYQEAGTLLVASRIDALLQTGKVEREVNPRAVANVLNFSTSLGPETIFTQVQRLLPGSLLISKSGETRITPYWDMRYAASAKSEERLARELEDVVEKAVAAQCKDGDPKKRGAFLSGGTDSSTVVGMMSRVEAGPAKSFSIGFEDQQFNELGYAEITASKFKSEHHTYLVSADDCFQALPRMIRVFDEPFGNSSAIPTYFCARLAAERGVTTLLAGDGGDEMFGGNEWYRTEQIFELYQRVPRLLRRGMIEPALSAIPLDAGYWGKLRRYVNRSNIPNPQRVLSYNFLCTHAPAEVFEKDFASSLGAYSVADMPTHYYRQAPATDHLNRLLYIDVKMTLGDSDLPKVTYMSELAGVQVRFPFLDRSVAEFAGSIPARLKVKGLEKRYLFKRAFRNLLPAEVIKKKKHGFGIPVASWLKSDPRLRELSRDLLLSNRSFERGYFRRSFIEELFRQHEADDSSYYGDTLWVFLALEMWHRQFVDQGQRVAI